MRRLGPPGLRATSVGRPMIHYYPQGKTGKLPDHRAGTRGQPPPDLRGVTVAGGWTPGVSPPRGHRPGAGCSRATTSPTATPNAGGTTRATGTAVSSLIAGRGNDGGGKNRPASAEACKILPVKGLGFLDEGSGGPNKHGRPGASCYARRPRRESIITPAGRIHRPDTNAARRCGLRPGQRVFSV